MAAHPPGLAGSVPDVTNSRHRRTLEESYYTIKQLGEGFWAWVWVSIPKEIANELVEQYQLGAKTIANFKILCNKLQAACVAAKFSKEQKEKNLTTEVGVLNAIKEYKSPHLAVIRDQEAGSAKHWYIQELVNAGTLMDMKIKYSPFQETEPVPVAFVWHMIVHICEAILLFDFGFTEDKQIENWTPLSHNDLHEYNIMFHRPTSGGRYKDYPDVCVVDYGNTFRLADSATPGQIAWLLNRQYNDVVNIFLRLDSFLTKNSSQHNKPDDLLPTLWERVPKVPVGATDNENLKQFLIKVVKEGRKRREQRYEPLPTKLAELLSAQTIDGEAIANKLGVTRPSS